MKIATAELGLRHLKAEDVEYIFGWVCGVGEFNAGLTISNLCCEKSAAELN